MQSLTNIPAPSQATPFLGSCRRCGSSNLFTKIEPPHIALRCRDCGAWQQWISKSKARRFQAAKIQTTSTHDCQVISTASFPAVTITTVSSDRDPDTDLSTRVQNLEREIASHDRELRIALKAIWACGVLQGSGAAPTTDVEDERVDELVRSLAQEEEGQ